MHELRLDRSDRIWVTREFYQRDADDYDWLRKAQEWGISDIRCDPSRAEKELEDLRRIYGMYGLKRCPPHGKGFDSRITLWRNRLTVREDGHPRIYISRNCPNLINELRNLAYEEPRLGTLDTNRFAKGCSDHAYDSTAYGLAAFDLPGPDYKYVPKVVEHGWDRTFA